MKKMRINNCLKAEWENGDKVKSNKLFNDHNWMGVFGTVTAVKDDFLSGQEVIINNGAFRIARYLIEEY
jgi:hypothetical protein